MLWLQLHSNRGTQEMASFISWGNQFYTIIRAQLDRPLFEFEEACFYLFTPHARGSTVLSRRRKGSSLVYPACAGIDLFFSYIYYSKLCLPRMRGDRPAAFP